MGALHKIGAVLITTQGLSRASRIILAFFAFLFGVVMCLTAPDNGKALYFYAFGAVCFVIGLACVTSGRVRQFFGSVIGTGLVVLSVWFVISQLNSGHILPSGPGDPSLLGSMLFSLAFGVPGLRYVMRVRFGLRRTSRQPQRMMKPPSTERD
jgi:membrane-bound ClpP family serine protease